MVVIQASRRVANFAAGPIGGSWRAIRLDSINEFLIENRAMKLTLGKLLDMPRYRIEYLGRPELLRWPMPRLVTDSRAANPGDIFLALKGEKFDGHQFVADALKKGVQLFVVSKSWFQTATDKHEQGNFLLVDDTLQALQEIGHFYRLQFDLPLLALTGSNGKTTTKEMISAILSCEYRVHKNKGNLNNHIGVPLSLLELTDEHEIAVIEMGTNHFGEISRLAELAQPTCGLITNIGPAHLEFFGSLQGVFRAKRELWQFLERNRGMAFVNVDDPLLGTHQPATTRLVTFGFEKPAEFQGHFLGLDDQGRATLKVGQESIKLGIAGMHNIYNALAAIAVGSVFDVSMAQMKAALEQFIPAARRMEVIQKHGITIINDCYNSNPASARKALLTLSQMRTNGRRVAVLADMLELGEAALPEHEAMADYIIGLGNIDWLLAYGPLSAAMIERIKRLGFKAAIHFEKKQMLIDYLKQIISRDDLLLVKGSRGMAMEEVTQHIIESYQ